MLAEGFDALTMRKIAKKIEYAPGTIYLHFANRDELALQLVQTGFGELLAFMAPVQGIADPLERVEAIGRGYVEFGLSHPETYRLIFMEDPKFTDEVMTMKLAPHGEPGSPGDQAFTLVFQTCEELIKSGRFKAIEPELCAYIPLWWARPLARPPEVLKRPITTCSPSSPSRVTPRFSWTPSTFQRPIDSLKSCGATSRLQSSARASMSNDSSKGRRWDRRFRFALRVKTRARVPTTKLSARIDDDRAGLIGVSDAAVQQLVSLAFGGVRATEIREADRQTPVRLRVLRFPLARSLRSNRAHRPASQRYVTGCRR